MTINLVPWREQRQLSYALKYVGSLVIGSLLIGILIMLYVHGLMKHLHEQQERNDQWHHQIQSLSVGNIAVARQQYQQVVQRIKYVQKLRSQENAVLATWQALMQLFPVGLRLTQLTWQQQQLILHGEAMQEQQVTRFVSMLQQDGHFSNCLLQHVGQKVLKTGARSSPHTTSSLLTEFTMSSHLSGKF